MKKLLHSSLLTFALIISGQSFARAGELIFGEEVIDGILDRLSKNDAMEVFVRHSREIDQFLS